MPSEKCRFKQKHNVALMECNQEYFFTKTIFQGNQPDGDAMFDEPRRYSSFSDRSDRSDGTEFREPPPPKRKVDHSPSPSLPTPTNKLPQVSSAVSLVSYSGGDDEKEDAFERADRAAENVSRPASPPSGMVEPRPPERVSQESDTDDENERLIDMALEDGRNAMKQIEDGGSTGSGGWTPRPYDSPLHGVDHEIDPKRVDTPPHQEVTIPPAPTTECDPELIEIFYKHFERKAAGIDVNVSVQERKDFQNPSSYEQLILNFGIDEVATLLHPKLLTVNYPRCCRYEKIAEDQRKHMDSINAAKKAASGGSSSAASIKKKA
ncbi:HCNGP-like protein [Ancylostoma duodenale]|uniref:HCNGP-like protein n=1 Tax=Ancylostoma duodenale TaxID=51022 RepID=A0A0C2GM07_9BILA|nr:HCNGP-like protein [Ancylostoma duodenale]